jgi:cysteine desulfurase/selenocysteine lyase
MKDIRTAKLDFPLFTHETDLVYLDAAATSLKPRSVIQAEVEYLEKYSANIARGLYPLAETVTEKFEAVRGKVASFIGADSDKEIIFTSGTTASINLAARLLASLVDAADNIVVTEMEHHSNFLPWKELAQERSAAFRVIPMTAEGTIDIGSLANSIDARTKIVAFSAVSNVLGTINPVKEIVAAIKNINPHALVLVDAAQAVGHMPLAVSEWDADFVAFSAHKMYGPTGVGVLYGKAHLLESLPPVVFGGGMVLDACAEDTLYKDIPARFEAGTPNIGGVIALGAAIDYIQSLGLANIRTHERALVTYALTRLQTTFGETLRIIGPADLEKRSGIIAFAFKDIHPHDIAALLGEQHICVRAGEHCTAPLHRALALPATTRLSFGVYTTKEDIDRLIKTLETIRETFTK